MSSIYLDYIPNELIYIIYTYTGVNNSFKNFNNNYKDIYQLYENNIIKGKQSPLVEDLPHFLKCFIGFDIFHFSRTKPTTSRIFVDSTSKYFQKEYNILKIIRSKISPGSVKDMKCQLYYETDSIKYLIDIFISTKDSTKNLYVLEMINDDDITHRYESYNWIDIWNKLGSESKKAILYQN